MNRPIACALALALSTAVLSGCDKPADQTSATDKAAMPAEAAHENPFFAESPLPLHFPQFDIV